MFGQFMDSSDMNFKCNVENAPFMMRQQRRIASHGIRWKERIVLDLWSHPSFVVFTYWILPGITNYRDLS